MNPDDDLDRFDDDYDPAKLAEMAATHQRVAGLAGHLSRAEVTAILRAHKAGYAYPGRARPGTPLVTNRTITNLAGTSAGLLDPKSLALTADGRRVAAFLLHEIRSYL